MIKSTEIIDIGTLLKPHGIKGEISADFDHDVDICSLRCIILDIEGIFVPFFITGVRQGASSSTLITIDGVMTEDDAKELCGKDVFALKSDLPETVADVDDGFYLADLIGFKVVSDEGQTIGTIEDFDDSTSNILLIVQPERVNECESKRLYIPFADEYITQIDADGHSITMSLPSGLLELNNNLS